MDAFWADVITTVHLGVVLFMLLGLVLILVGGALRWSWVRNPWFRVVHLGIMVYIAQNAIRGELCFLTIWEHDLRAAAGQTLSAKDEWSFVGRLLHDILFVDMPQDELDVYYLVFGGVVLAATLFVPPRLRRRGKKDPESGTPAPGTAEDEVTSDAERPSSD